jgi:hypothetical protein
VPELLRQVLHDLEVGYDVSIATLVRERNPHVSVFEGTCLKLLTITILLIDRSLGNRGYLAHKIFVICNEPQQGELTNEEVLQFFKSLIKHTSGGPLYIEILEEIEDYRLKWWMLIKVHTFFYKRNRIITVVLSISGVLVGIFKALFSLKNIAQLAE